MKTLIKLTWHAARKLIPIARRQLNRHPRLKRRVVNVLRAQLMRGTRTNNSYQSRIMEFFPDAIDLLHASEELREFNYRPLISILIPTYNTDINFLRDCLDSVLSQLYENWELCIIDDASPNQEVRGTIKLYAKLDNRIKYKFLTTNHHIAGATNQGLAIAKGEFVALLDHDDILWPNALFEVVKALNENRKIDFIYSDEDKITENRYEHLGPFFKPDWNPDFLHSINYITHLSVIRTDLLRSIKGLRKEYNGAQDWDLFLRISRITSHIHHIPKLLYSWRIHSLSTAKTTDAKPYVVEAQRRAIQDDVKAKGYNDAIVEQDKNNLGYWQVTYPLKGNPLISIVIPSKNQYKILKRCINSIYNKTTYKNFEIVLVDTGSTDQKVLRYYKRLQRIRSNFTLVDWPEKPFSYSRSCNEGVEKAKGDLVVLLNNDTEVVTPDWLQLMAGDAQRAEIGSVGCLLFYPDGYHIQHAGIGVGLGGVAANSFSMMTLEQPLTQTQHLMIHTKHNMSAITAACLMMRKNLFQKVGGFAEEFPVSYNDVDLGLRLLESGYQNLYTPFVRLLHHESISVGAPNEAQKRDTAEFRAAKKLFISRWKKYISHDPNLNPNLSKDNAFYDI